MNVNVNVYKYRSRNHTYVLSVSVWLLGVGCCIRVGESGTRECVNPFESTTVNNLRVYRSKRHLLRL